MRAKQSTGINIGGSSILVIFVLLCLTTFATLSMVSANADYKLALKSAEALEKYYAADAVAEEVLAQVNAVLLSAAVTSQEEYLSKVSIGLGAIATVPVSFSPTSPQSGTAVYTIPLDDIQALTVVLDLAQSISGKQYRIAQWKVQSTAPLLFEEEESLILWNGTATA